MSNGTLQKTAFEETPIENVARALIYIYNKPEDRMAALKRFEETFQVVNFYGQE